MYFIRRAVAFKGQIQKAEKTAFLENSGFVPLKVTFLESSATSGGRIGVCTVSGIFVWVLRPPARTSVWKEVYFICCKYWFV